MRVGLLYDFANPPAWHRPTPELYAAELAQIVRAEALGIDGIWVAEHHFTPGYVSSPIPVLGAIAALTKRVRIGTSILVTPLYSPIRLAEDFALLDILSNGRVEMGAGLGWSVEEYQCFGINPKQRVSVMREVIEIVRKAWTEDRFSFEGKNFNYRDISVLPKPIQRPHPPILGGASSVAGARRIARWGLPLMWIDRAMSEAYIEELGLAGHAADSARIDGFLNLFVCDDPEKIWPELRPHYRYQSARNSGPDRPRAAAGGAVEYSPVPTLDDIDAARGTGAIIVVTPEQAIAEIRARTHGLPVSGIIVPNRLPGLSDALSDRHVQLLATAVAPGIA